MHPTATDQALSPGACLSRLVRRRRGFVACTDRALPSVLPADLRLHSGRLLLTVDPTVRESLVGQVVAVGVGRTSWVRPGWQVVARGRIGAVDGSELPLEHYVLEGRHYPRLSLHHPLRQRKDLLP